MRGWFVTGTDTGVGKTFVTGALARSLSGVGLRVAAIKPAESGCQRRDGRLWAEDAEGIAAAAGGWQGPEDRCLYRFAAPLAPAVAARLEGKQVDMDAAVAFVRRVAARAERTLVEGAGGWLVPLAEGQMIADLACRLALPVIVVARASLGTINHSLLTVEAIERRGAVPAAVVLSRRPADDAEVAEANAAEIRAAWGGEVVVMGPEGWTRPPAVFHVER